MVGQMFVMSDTSQHSTLTLMPLHSCLRCHTSRSFLKAKTGFDEALSLSLQPPAFEVL